MSEVSNILNQIMNSLDNYKPGRKTSGSSCQFTILMDNLLALEKRLKKYISMNYDYCGGPETPDILIRIRSKLSITIIKYERVLNLVSNTKIIIKNTAPVVTVSISPDGKMKILDLINLLANAKALYSEYESEIVSSGAREDYQNFLERLKEVLQLIKSFFTTIQEEN